MFTKSKTAVFSSMIVHFAIILRREWYNIKVQAHKIDTLKILLCQSLESNSLEALMERVKIAMPDMLEFTCNYTGPVNLHFKAERITRLEAAV